MDVGRFCCSWRWSKFMDNPWRHLGVMNLVKNVGFVLNLKDISAMGEDERLMMMNDDDKNDDKDDDDDDDYDGHKYGDRHEESMTRTTAVR